jgi:hypothetical protein
MTQAHTLVRHRDIQAWVTDRRGMPAIVQAHDKFGELRARLALRFSVKRAPGATPEDGVCPVSWSAWLAELDRQQLVLRVSDEDDAEYELIARKSLN